MEDATNLDGSRWEGDVGAYTNLKVVVSEVAQPPNGSYRYVPAPAAVLKPAEGVPVSVKTQERPERVKETEEGLSVRCSEVKRTRCTSLSPSLGDLVDAGDMPA